MIRFDREKFVETIMQRYGFLFRIVARFKDGSPGRGERKKRLALLERISIAPRQSLALIEAEGRRILVATSADGGSAFFALDGLPSQPGIHPQSRTIRSAQTVAARVSW